MVLECVFISDVNILQFLLQVLIFFRLAGPLTSLREIVRETELGKRLTSLNLEGAV